MRGIEARNLSLNQWNSYWGILGFPSAPTIDGVFLPKSPIEMLQEGGFPKSEILVGTNKDEGIQFKKTKPNFKKIQSQTCYYF
jgi:acetylcholinesterase